MVLNGAESFIWANPLLYFSIMSILNIREFWWKHIFWPKNVFFSYLKHFLEKKILLEWSTIRTSSDGSATLGDTSWARLIIKLGPICGFILQAGTFQIFYFAFLLCLESKTETSVAKAQNYRGGTPHNFEIKHLLGGGDTTHTLLGLEHCTSALVEKHVPDPPPIGLRVKLPDTLSTPSRQQADIH